MTSHNASSRKERALSYNAKKKTPNWVSWCLRKADIGKAELHRCGLLRKVRITSPLRRRDRNGMVD
jgi:hypothetical protein